MQNITARNFGLYGIAVCWAAAIIFIPVAGFSTVFLFRHLAPQVTLQGWEREQYGTNDLYWERRRHGQPEAIRPAEDVLSRERGDAYRRHLVRESDDGLALLVRAGSFLLIDLLVFIAHWIFSRRMHRLASGI